MAYLETLEDEERKRLELGGGAAPMSSGGAGAVQSQPKAPEPGFANLANYFTANKDAAQAQGAATTADLLSGAQGAVSGDSPGEAMDVYGQLDAAQTPGGLATVLQDNKDPQYTAGMAGLDAYLGTRGSEPGQFQAMADYFKPLLSGVETAVEDPGAPPVGPYDIAAISRDPMARANLTEWEQKLKAYEDWKKRKAERTTRAGEYGMEGV